MVQAEEITKLITAALPDAQVQVYDMTGGGDHYQVKVVSQAFAGIAALQRHRLVYAPLQALLGGALHALALDTRTPEEEGGSHEHT